MSIDLTEATITKEVQSTFDGCPDRRTRELFVELVRHLHDFARETRLTGDEWFTAMDFLARVGRVTTPTRQEFVLLSDVLGVSVLVDLINEHHGPHATDGTLLGPFFVEGRPQVPNGADISGGLPGTPMFVTGRVLGPDGDPLAGVHDAVFAAKRSLVADFVEHGPGTAPDGTEVGEPFQTVDWTFTLTPAAPERRP